MQEVLVHLLGALLLHHFALLELVADTHGKARYGGRFRERDLEAPLTPPRLGVVEGEMQLREGERILDDSASLERHQREPRAVRSRERDGCAFGRLRVLPKSQ